MRGPLLPLTGIAAGAILGLGIARVPGLFDGGDVVLLGAAAGGVTGAFLGYWEWIPRRKRWDLAGILPAPLRGLYAGLMAGPAAMGLLVLLRVASSGRRIRTPDSPAVTLFHLCVDYWIVSLPVGLLLGIALAAMRRGRPAPPAVPG